MGDEKERKRENGQLIIDTIGLHIDYLYINTSIEKIESKNHFKQSRAKKKKTKNN